MIRRSNIHVIATSSHSTCSNLLQTFRVADLFTPPLGGCVQHSGTGLVRELGGAGLASRHSKPSSLSNPFESAKDRIHLFGDLGQFQDRSQRTQLSNCSGPISAKTAEPRQLIVYPCYADPCIFILFPKVQNHSSAHHQIQKELYLF